jgi:hypothetical protein
MSVFTSQQRNVKNEGRSDRVIFQGDIRLEGLMKTMACGTGYSVHLMKIQIYSPKADRINYATLHCIGTFHFTEYFAIQKCV